jgi:uncharacterized protein (TIGR02996 family)
MMSNMSLVDLEKAVIDNPDAEAPRLAFAEASDADGDRDRAEFIRLQIETAHRIREGREDWSEFVHRKRELRNAHGDDWARAIRRRVLWYDFYGGFVEAIELDASDFLARAEELYQVAPIRRLILKGVAPVIDKLFNSPHLARIVSLGLGHQRLGDAGVELLAASPYLSKLALLDLPGNQITLAAVDAMAASSTLPSLQQVNFAGNPAKSVSEIVGLDGADGRTLFPSGSEDALKIEQRHGRKTWLQAVEDHGRRELHPAEF